jgi:hypothetical protein
MADSIESIGRGECRIRAAAVKREVRGEGGRTGYGDAGIG